MPAYLYAILRHADASAPDLPPVGPGEGSPAVTPVGALAIVHSPIDAAEATPSRRNMIAHTRILEALNRQGPILPCRFGTIAPSPQAIARLVGGQERHLRATLDRLDGHIEFGLRITMDEQAAITRIVAAEPRLREVSRRAARLAPAQAHQARLDLGRDVARRLAARREEVARAALALMAPFAQGQVIHASQDEMTALNAAFLLRAGDEARVMAAIEGYEAQNGDWLTLRCISPAPPYNFVAFSLAAPAMVA